MILIIVTASEIPAIIVEAYHKSRTGLASDSNEVIPNADAGLWKENLRVSNEPKKGSNLPFSPPAPVSQGPSKSRIFTKKKKLNSSRKQLRNAKKDPKSAIIVRRLVTGFGILIATSIAVTAVIAPSFLEKVVSGEFVQKNETCTVTEINKTLFFDTTCGKFEWSSERQPGGTPSANLIEGEIYTFNSQGLRIEPARVFPIVITYEKAALPG